MIYDDLGIDLQKSYGFGFDDEYDVSRLPALDEADRNKWYSKFYYAGRTEPDAETKKLFAPGRTMDPACALLPGSFDRLLQRPNDDDEGDLGYCLLPNGVAYGSTHTLMRGITPEMFSWYKTLRMIDRLSYQIWYPGAHHTEVDGNTIEDVGFGRCVLHFLRANNWQNLGFPCPPAEADPQFGFMIGAGSANQNLDHPEIRPMAASLFHYVRVLPEGLDFRTHFFIGGMCLDGELVCVQHIQPEVALEIARRMVSHCCYERVSVQTFLPELYEKMKDADLSAAAGKTGGLAIQK